MSHDTIRWGVLSTASISDSLIPGLLAAAGGVSWGLSRLKPAAPSVERATVWLDTVKRGPMLRQVRGLGTLVP